MDYFFFRTYNRRIARKQHFYRRSHPYEELSDEQFRGKFRMSKEVFSRFFELIKSDISIPSDDRGMPTKPTIKVLIALRFYASGSFQDMSGELLGTSQSQVSKIIEEVTTAICKKAKDVILMPTMSCIEKEECSCLCDF